MSNCCHGEILVWTELAVAVNNFIWIKNHVKIRTIKSLTTNA